jgi:hypothetical protein
VSKALESALGLEAVSWSDHKAGAMAANNFGVDIPERGNYVATTDCDMLLLPCLDTQLYAHVKSQTRAALILNCHMLKSMDEEDS